jgi:hypothetical protein
VISKRVFGSKGNGINVRERRVIDTTGWKFDDESPKSDLNLDDFLIDLVKEEQKTDTAITHDDFNASVETATQTSLEEKCSKYLVSETPNTNTEVLEDDLEEQPNHSKLARVALL